MPMGRRVQRLTRLCEDIGRGGFCADREKEFTYNGDSIAANLYPKINNTIKTKEGPKSVARIAGATSVVLGASRTTTTTIWKGSSRCGEGHRDDGKNSGRLHIDCSMKLRGLV